MTAFVLAAAALIALALAFLLPAVWRDARRSALVICALLPLSAAGLYWGFGEPDAIDPANRRAPATIEEAVAQLERRLAREPESLDGWVLLGRTRKNQGSDRVAAGQIDAAMADYAAAADALRRAQTIAPDVVDLRVELAEALSLANAERQFDAEATGLLDSVLAAQPAHPRALWFRGIAAMQAGDAPGAVSRWEALIPLVDEATAAAVREQVAAARASAGLPPMSPTLDAAPTPAPDAESTSISTEDTVRVRVEADPALLASLPPEAVLFVFARNADAPGPPVAVKRVEQAKLPLTVTLSDADRVMPTALLSTTARVEVSARFARSGALTTDSSDLIAKPAIAELGAAEAVTLRLEASEPAIGSAD